jgi:acetoin utilization deacetylase AcuC-like enzyme
LSRRWVFSPRYTVDLGAHTFPADKFLRVARMLVQSGLLREEDRVEPELPPAEDLLLVHTPDWVSRTLNGKLILEEETLMELPWSRPLVEAHALAVSGTAQPARLALEHGLGLHIGGGANHAFADHGEGFCMFNDLACAVAKLRREGRIRRALIVDLDTHQGNGTASIFRREPDVFTFSMHQEDGYPSERRASTLDIPLPKGAGDREYLDLLTQRLPGALDSHRPELVIYQAGVDVFERDMLGTLRLTMAGIEARDRFVFESCGRRAIPIALTLGGGYGEDIEQTVALHAGTVRAALEILCAEC